MELMPWKGGPAERPHPLRALRGVWREWRPIWIDWTPNPATRKLCLQWPFTGHGVTIWLYH